MYGASRQPICMLGENLRASMKTSSKNHAEGRCLRGLLKRCPVTASSNGTACLKVPCPATPLFHDPCGYAHGPWFLSGGTGRLGLTLMTRWVLLLRP